MIEDGHRGIIGEIDALANDGASWSATGEHTQRGWATARAGGMRAVALTMTGALAVDISESEPGGDIERHVGAARVKGFVRLRKVQFWVGDCRADRGPVNAGATRLLRQVLADIGDGGYVASDRERGQARALLAGPDGLTVIHGPCLITGVGDDGSAAPLDENFQSWFSVLLDELERARAAVVVAVGEAIGIPPELLRGVVVVDVR